MAVLVVLSGKVRRNGYRRLTMIRHLSQFPKKEPLLRHDRGYCHAQLRSEILSRIYAKEDIEICCYNGMVFFAMVGKLVALDFGDYRKQCLGVVECRPGVVVVV